MRYRRNYAHGGTYFFTVNLHDREMRLLTEHIRLLRSAVATVKASRPFQIDAWVVLPDHLHAIWTLPDNDSDYSTRWREIKKLFTKSVSRIDKRLVTGKGMVWQDRFWEHTIRDERDFKHHFDYVHFNPVKHGWVERVVDWPYSSFHREVKRGIYHPSWNLC
ncbi:transposase [Salinivibrio sp. ML323]|uniref:REP-associated tyrosine transposase n=1 Tax=Salinivibrio sp. ML323 TaxID=1909474 RepID=UPI0009841681|nr:transposase [Salinivibrio sp. ML323]